MRVARPARRTATLIVLFLVVAAVAVHPASGQTTIGLDLGLAGIENYDPFAPSIGASVTVPVVSRLSLSAAYARWLGRDGNEGFLSAGEDLRSGFGNQALLLSGLMRVVGAQQGTHLSLGAGVGLFQHYRIENGTSRSWYDATPTGSVLLRFGSSGRFAPYIRADVQIPNEIRLNYGLFRVGADITIR